MSDVRTLNRATAPLRRRIMLLARRAVLLLTADTEKLRRVQLEVHEGEVQDRVEHFEPYGFTSRPLAGAEALLLAVHGTADHGIAPVVTDRRYRPRGIAAGDVAIFSHEDDPAAAAVSARARLQIVGGRKLVGRFDEIDLRTPSGGQLLLSATEAKLTLGSLTVRITASEITIDGASVRIQGKPDYKVHEHTNVQAGASNTGPVAS